MHFAFSLIWNINIWLAIYSHHLLTPSRLHLSIRPATGTLFTNFSTFYDVEVDAVTVEGSL
jgi:hypothetical protein